MSSIWAAIQGNPALTGAVGLMATGAVLYVLRAIPLKILDGMIWAFSVRLSVSGDDEVFDWVNEWLGSHRYAQRARTLKLSTGRAAQGGWTLAPGFGRHVFWDGGLVILGRQIDEKAGGSGWSLRPRERIEIRILGRKQHRLRAMIAKANAHRQAQDAVGVRVWNAGYWLAMPSKPKRAIESVFLPHDQKREILEHTEWFFGAREWFATRGIPYRHGYLFHGVPGSGKTSLVMALASHFNRPIYILNLATLQNDNEMLSAFAQAGANSIILIEDVDAADAAAKRDPSVVATPGDEKAMTGVSLSGLLNAIDGVAAPEGRLLVLTTNHISKLDPALIRSARIDKRFEFGPLAREQVAEMAARFFPGDEVTQAKIEEIAAASVGMSAADWQDRMMDIARGTVASKAAVA